MKRETGKRGYRETGIQGNGDAEKNDVAKCVLKGPFVRITDHFNYL